MGKTTEKTAKKQRAGIQKPEFHFDVKDILKSFQNEKFKFILGIFLAFLGIYVILSYVSFIFNGGIDQSALASASADVANSGGSGGARLTQLMVNGWFGFPSVLMPVLLVIIGLRLTGIIKVRMTSWIISCVFVMIWASVFLQFTLSGLMSGSFIVPGGAHGKMACGYLQHTVGIPGLLLILAFSMLVFCIWATGSTISWVRNRAEDIKGGIKTIEKTFMGSRQTAGTGSGLPLDPQEDPYRTDDDTDDLEDTSEPVSPIGTDEPAEPAVTDDAIGPVGTAEPEEEPELQDIEGKDGGTTAPDGGPEAGELDLQPYDPRLDLSHYKFPTLDLLKHYGNAGPAIDETEQKANKERIITVLRNFGIEIDSIQATVGPTITLYEITPAAGVRISKIKNLEADIALSLAALGIRIIAPMPGQGTIGIEVPNKNPMMVSMESILNTKKFASADMELPVALGRTITNDVYMVDLAKMPHLLVAGATGQGKSVGLNCIITSLLYKKHPAELKLVMVDPKMVEFSVYAPIIRHFLAKLPDEEDAIITDTTKVVHTLKSLCIEMDSRYELLKQANVRSIKEYNELFKSRRLNPEKGHRFLPYIVVIIDEFGDLIMTAGKDIEMPIARIAQKARAVGMHMIIATQRPTTNIITGTIKANFPARMAFRVTSMIDSRTILDRPGANQLIGRGDMLFSKGAEPDRVQCAFVDTPEVNAIVSYISGQQGYTEAYPLPEYIDENEAGNDNSGVEMGKFDPLFAEAARLVVINQLGSTSLIQRKFAIGYNRAGRIMDQFEKTGVVGRQDGSKPRQVLIADETQLNRVFETYNIQ
ncbi:MAG: DNA translocase FtsK [Bacteroidaceae bacterium]|nr:DNA translocase FtsK [Bacteroidaceae bacterium]